MLLILAGIEQNPGPKMSKQTTLETSLDRDKDIKDLINALTKRLDSWGERLESRLSAIDDRVENINQRLQQLEESSAVTKAALSQNSKKIKDLEDQLEHLDAKSRERNLIFYGIEQDNNEDCRERIRKVIKENMQTKEKINITRCHRLSRKPGAPILIEVPEQNDRLTLFKAALNLRGTKISLSKDYSMKMREQRRVLNVKRRELVEKGTLAKLRDNKLLINGIAYKCCVVLLLTPLTTVVILCPFVESESKLEDEDVSMEVDPPDTQTSLFSTQQETDPVAIFQVDTEPLLESQEQPSSLPHQPPLGVPHIVPSTPTRVNYGYSEPGL
ncbi:hypothetical protein LAZ67_19000290 [Cordylochernes scorpioides]|uniref:Uncharacterized protein n=1 Tax=Cordylochernes scorpioides TaxID=51811 RepID=A0ABY6LJ91_9ARAC|nr:hypothetical protein LAZ67_19000290 [Cordylochernes scorpioides]